MREDKSLWVTGASGLLGSALVAAAREQEWAVTALCHRNPVPVANVPVESLDLCESESVEALLARQQPAWIVHCAALTDVDGCEANPEAARRLNRDVPCFLAQAARRARVGLVYISTDSVFDGQRGDYSEDDVPSPLNVYAASKREGEQAVRRELESALVVRTNIFGWSARRNPTLAEWILGKLRADEEVPGFSDVFFSPILVNDLSDSLLEMMSRRLSGLFHVAGAQGCSKWGFARRLAQEFGFDERLVRRTLLDEAALRAPRPRNTTLDVSRIEGALGRSMPTLDDALRRFRELHEAGYPARLRAASL